MAKEDGASQPHPSPNSSPFPSIDNVSFTLWILSVTKYTSQDIRSILIREPLHFSAAEESDNNPQ